MEIKGTLVRIAKELAKALTPFKEALESPENFISFMAELGWEADSVFPQFANIHPLITSLQTLAREETATEADLAKLMGVLDNTVNAILDLQNQDYSAITTIHAPDFKSEFPKQVLNYLITTYLMDTYPKISHAIRLAGIIRTEQVEAEAMRLAYEKIEVVWADLARFVSDPKAVLKDAYNWGKASFDEEKFKEAVHDFIESLGFDFLQKTLPEEIRTFLEQGIPDPGTIFSFAYHLILLEKKPPENQEAGIYFQTVPAVDSLLPGFAIIPYASGSFEKTIDLNASFNLILEFDHDLSKGIVGFVRPDELTVKTNILNNPSGEDPGDAFRFRLGLQTKNQAGKPMILFGDSGGSRLEFQSLTSMLGIRMDENGKPVLLLETELKGGKLVISLAAADGFLSTVLGAGGIESTFDLKIGWSSQHGIYFEGSGGLNLEIPTHIDLLFAKINKTLLSLQPRAESLLMELSSNLDIDLGPMAAAVEKMGIRPALKFSEDMNGNLGVLDFSLDFKPPEGVGLSLDTGIVKGGGFLQIDAEKGQYYGSFEVSFAELVSLTVVGIIETKMPDGSRGFSMILIITADFGSGIQLGFGFTLLAVGGLIGVNRTMKLDALARGVRSGSVNSVMFPSDVVKNAPRIISDLKEFFPVRQGSFLIGPMARLGWGTPTLISISLGIIIEIPGNIAILGILEVVLPDKHAPLIVFKVNFIGAIEFDKEHLWFFASLYDSRILYITLEGEMGVLVAWGNHPNFVASLGGFHPAFQPPALPFPEPNRISFSLLNESNAKIRILGYFAVTSNTVQFGARAELFFGFSEFKVEGHLGFDALFQFSPFYMILEISASLSVKVFGFGLFSLGLKARLEGPGPWKINGKGTIEVIWFLEITVNISTTWGAKEDTTLPDLEIMPVIAAELRKKENWKTSVPSQSRIGVTLKELQTEEVVLHPIGTLQISQKTIPLNYTLDKIGAQKPKDANKLNLEPAGSGLSKINTIDEFFAEAQFRNMKDTEKLAAPAFQKLEGGIELSAGEKTVQSASAVERRIRYDLTILDDNFRLKAIRILFVFLKPLFDVFLRGNTTSNSVLSHKNLKFRQPFEEKISKTDLHFAIASKKDNRIHNNLTFNSRAKASEYLEEQIRNNPRLAREVHILPATELNPAA